MKARLALFLFATMSLLRAQSVSSSATIQGAVADSSGGAVPRARVVARQQETGTERVTESGPAGQFVIPSLAPGQYTLRLEAAGFAPVSVQAFPLTAGQVVSQRFEVVPAGLAEKLEVREQPDAIDVTAPTASVSLGYDRIEEAPARSRNYLNFVLAAPAVAPSAGSSSQRTMTGTRAPLGDSGFTFGGLRPRNNAIQIDGLDNRDETTGGSRVAVGLEMVQEFRVTGTAVGAELGGAAGGLLNMVTRSGVNTPHGDVTMFAQNEIFNARRTEVSAARPEFRRYQPGFSLNGPLRRDRTFLAGAVEYEYESAEEWSNVPADALARINGATRGLYPTGTRGVDSSLKLNHQAGLANTLSARYAFSRGRVQSEVQGPDNFPDRSAQGSSLTADHSLVGNWLRLISPRVVNDVRLQLGQRRMDLTPNAPGQTPMFEIPGVATFGRFHRLDAVRTERHYQAVEQLNAAVGSHRLSLGADAHIVTLDSAMRNRFAGIFVFPTLEDFVASRPDMFIQAFGDPATSMRTVPLGLWLADRWELRPGLQLELGLRYDRQRMPAGVTRSSNNVAPRAGIAWRPSARRPLVIRVATGLFYDRYPLAFLNEAVQKNGVNAFEQVAWGQDAARAYALSGGATLTAPLAGAPRLAYRTAADFPSTYSRKFTAGFEHALDKETSVSVEASHIRGLRLPRIRSYLLEQTARSSYAGISVSLNRRPSRELTYLIAYSAGRTLDDGSDFDEQALDPLNIRRDWAKSRQHQAHRIAASAVFELPMDDAAFLPEWLREAFEEVSFAPILSAGSGRPINALLTADVYRTGAYPLTARPAGFARNPFRSPANVSLDLRVMKTLHVMNDRAVLQFGVESFNLNNHPNVERVSQFYAQPAAASTRLASYGQPLESLPARQLQFMMQFEF